MAKRAIYRNARISSRKVRPVADLVRGKFADEALDILKYLPQRGARMIEKTLQSAVGNAQDPEQNSGRSFNASDLIVTEVRIDGGPMFKRIRPVSRGMAYMIKKRTSHITVEVSPVDEL